MRRTPPSLAPLGAARAAALVTAALLAAAPSLAQGPLTAATGRTAPAEDAVAHGGGPWAELARHGAARHGAPGARAVAFLAEHAPARDAALDAELLRENLDLAFEARARFPWARELPEERFLNDVLPYAVLDETRERWRPAMLELAAPIVADCSSAAAAAAALNRELFNAIGVHYNTGRKRPNQSPAESIAQGRATCTGLSIILVDACRAVGVPARVAGVASWHDKRGNHTWVEIWDGGWRYLGADEYDAAGLDRGWFTADAARAVPGNLRFAVWASSWRRNGQHFPMVWAPADRSVPAVDVSERYRSAPADGTPGRVVLNVRVWDTAGGARVEADLALVELDGTALVRERSRAGRADLNDMPALAAAPAIYVVDVAREGETRHALVDARDGGVRTVELCWDTLLAARPGSTPTAVDDGPARGLGRDAAAAALAERWERARGAARAALATELEAQKIVHGEHELRLLEKAFGDAPEGRRSLWISMHGGGGAPPEVNDRQWANQIRLYEPEEGYYVAPRAPTNTWNLWHQGHVDPLFDRLIAAFVATRGVDPDRVYLMGYSAGGDGVYQLAPRAADRYAAVAMMAGHPNETRPDGLRNLPFALFMGGDDRAYDRNAVAARFGAALDELAERDPGGYPHRVTIYPGKGHWMDGADREALPWMAARTRDPWPPKVVWLQDDVTHRRFYWLEVAEKDAVARREITAEVVGQTVWLTSAETRRVTLRLRDELLDLDRPVVVLANGVEVFRGSVPRTVAAIDRSLAARLDPRTAATGELVVAW